MAYTMEKLSDFKNQRMPIFNQTFVENKTSTEVYQKWVSLPVFVYDVQEDECLTCNYKPEFKDVDGNFFMG